MHTHLYNSVKLISFKEGEIIINSENISDPNFSRNVARYISKWTGRIWTVSLSNSNIGKSLREEDIIIHQKEIDNELLFTIPNDLQWFKKHTGSHENEQNIVIMGLNTWLSLPKKPLPNRMNIILTKNHS